MFKVSNEVIKRDRGSNLKVKCGYKKREGVIKKKYILRARLD